MIKVVFFDFDGTISDAKKIAYDSMVLTMRDFGYDFDDKLLRELMGLKMHIILKGLGIKTDEIDVVKDKFYEYFTRAAIDGGIRPCVSLKPLWEMKKMGLPLIVVSNSRTSFLKASIKKLKIRGLFDEIYGSEDFESKDEMLKKLIKKMGIRPSEAIYIGDRFSDVDFARDAGCIAIGINNKCSWSTLKLIKKERPDYIVRDFYGLRKVVRKLEHVE